jgi:inorganic pyrophosphatase
MKTARRARTRPPALDRLTPYDSGGLTVVIETAKGSQNKCAYDPRLGGFLLKGVLPVGAVFPFDFGFIPSTRGEDGDPLDVLVLMDSPAFAGCIVVTRLIGAIEAEQTEHDTTERNDRLIAVAATSITHKSLQEIGDVNEDLLGQIEHFFKSYNAAKGKQFVPKGRIGSAAAKKLVDAGIRRARKS